MPKQNSTICKLCQKILAQDEAVTHYCDNWCGKNIQEHQQLSEDNKRTV